MKKPADIIGQAAVEALRAAGWIVVRHDAIRLAQAYAREELDEGSEYPDGYRDELQRGSSHHHQQPALSALGGL